MKQSIREKWEKSLPANDKGAPLRTDWLVSPTTREAAISRGKHPGELIMENGLVSRTFSLAAGGNTMAYDNLMTGEALLRCVRPVATAVLNQNRYVLGSRFVRKEHAYLTREWQRGNNEEENGFQLADFDVGDIKAPFPWKRIRHCDDRPWPPHGKELKLIYRPSASAPTEIKSVEITIHYECYDGIPLFSKRINISNKSPEKIRLNSYINEDLALVEFKTCNTEERLVRNNYPHISFEYDFACGGCTGEEERAIQIEHWETDPDFTTQVDFLSQSRNLYKSYLEMGPDIDILSDSFTGFREFQLIHTGTDRQRRGLAICRMYRTIAPWVGENPLIFHLVSSRREDIDIALEQIREVGFEMLNFSFGSGFNRNVLEYELENPEGYSGMIKEVKENYGNALHEAGIGYGGYSLLASRKISFADDVVNPYTGKTSDMDSPLLEEGIEAIQGLDEASASISGVPRFGNSPCLGSEWGQRYFKSLYKVIEDLDMETFTHDGSYPGDLCASTGHPGHRDLGDSLWTQWRTITDFYKWLRARGVYLRVPDWYMLSGSNQTGIGYKEVNWSLPRDRQIILGRQNIYDGTWEKTPTMGWTFCPLTNYHTVEEYPREAATIEPLCEHLDHYEAHLAQDLGSGVQAVFRGLRLYDTEETKALVIKYVEWYKKYRDILTSDIVHIRRPDGRNIDGFLHVNPRLENKGLAMFFNPSSESLEEFISIPLYYTGLTGKVHVSEREKGFNVYDLNRDYTIDLPISIGPGGFTWLLFKDEKK